MRFVNQPDGMLLFPWLRLACNLIAPALMAYLIALEWRGDILSVASTVALFFWAFYVCMAVVWEWLAGNWRVLFEEQE